jgi:hypothetical protein
MTTIADRLPPAQRSLLRPPRPRRRTAERKPDRLEQARAELAAFVVDGWQLRPGRLSPNVVVAERDTTKLYATSEKELVSLLRWRTGADSARRAPRITKTNDEGEQE